MSAYPGDWTMCYAGDPAPLGAIRAPDKFNSFICIWPDKDHTFGRGVTDMYTPGMDAWFPYGNCEWAASQQKCRFGVLVDDGKVPGLYSWQEVFKVPGLKASGEMEPLTVNGLSPMIIHNILGKGSAQYHTGWTCFDGRETNHDKWTVERSLVLCRRVKTALYPPLYNDRREIKLNVAASISQNQVRSERIHNKTHRLCNDSDSTQNRLIEVRYQDMEGEVWLPNESATSDLDTFVDSQNIVRKLAHADYAIGRALYGKHFQPIKTTSTALVRSYAVPARTVAVIETSIYKQSCELNCSGEETIINREGKVIMRRTVNGRWRGVTCSHVKVSIEEKPALDGED